MIWLMVAALASKTTEAEAHRLTDRLLDLERRNIWSGVERTYRRAVATGETLSTPAHLAGVRAALQSGDADLARERLLLAYTNDRSQELLDWLTVYTRDYARLHIRVDPGAELEVERLPFDADRARVVVRAQEQVRLHQQFDGLLPLGRYRVGSFWFTITQDGPDILKDLRTCAVQGTVCPVDPVDPTVQRYER